MAVEKKKPEAPLSDKKKALETAISQIEKNFGKGTVMRLGDRPEMNVEAIPTGSLALDAALGIGGVPKGRIIEIYGPESSGKTTLALHIVAQAQKRGGEVAFVDAAQPASWLCGVGLFFHKSCAMSSQLVQSRYAVSSAAPLAPQMIMAYSLPMAASSSSSAASVSSLRYTP